MSAEVAGLLDALDAFFAPLANRRGYKWVHRRYHTARKRCVDCGGSLFSLSALLRRCESLVHTLHIMETHPDSEEMTPEGMDRMDASSDGDE